jgi:hypothetical protein
MEEIDCIFERGVGAKRLLNRFKIHFETKSVAEAAPANSILRVSKETFCKPAATALGHKIARRAPGRKPATESPWAERRALPGAQQRGTWGIHHWRVNSLFCPGTQATRRLVEVPAGPPFARKKRRMGHPLHRLVKGGAPGPPPAPRSLKEIRIEDFASTRSR